MTQSDCDANKVLHKAIPTPIISSLINFPFILFSQLSAKRAEQKLRDNNLQSEAFHAARLHIKTSWGLMFINYLHNSFLLLRLHSWLFYVLEEMEAV